MNKSSVVSLQIPSPISWAGQEFGKDEKEYPSEVLKISTSEPEPEPEPEQMSRVRPSGLWQVVPKLRYCAAGSNGLSLPCTLERGHC
jgi:hypothetical protein